MMWLLVVEIAHKAHAATETRPERTAGFFVFGIRN
jgi:hypothetical protein